MKLANAKRLVQSPRAALDALRLAVMLQGDVWRAGHRFGRDLSEDERRLFAAGVLAGTGVQLTFTTGDLTWTSDADEIGGICRELLLTGSYYRDEMDEVIAWVETHRAGCTNIVDVGANIGTTAIPFARAGYDVLAIEAVPSTYEMLVANVRRNGVADKVRCVNAAVSEAATVTMNLTGSSAMNEVAGAGRPGFETHGLRTSGTVTVDGARLDDLVTGWCDPAAVALVWSDTQGSETDVISAGGELWATTPMWVEFWPAGLEVHGGTARFLELVVDRFSHFAVSGDLDAVSPVDALTAAMADRRHVNLLLLP
jgi:FkbM family methyltransferase